MIQWQVRAESSNGAVIMFGVAAADRGRAEAAARECIPFRGAYWFTVLPVPHPLEREEPG